MYQRRIYKFSSFLILLAFVVTTFVFEYPALACTSVCLAKNGHVVFGNNLDWFIDDGLIVINKRNVKKHGIRSDNPPEWISRYASITVNQSGNGFPCRGMNEAGLVIGEMWLGSTSYPERDDRHSVISDHWIQYQLDTCATVEEVLATDKVLRIDKDEYKSHFFVCDASGKCATVEWFDGKLSAHIGDEVKIKVMTNSPYAECLAQADNSSGRFAKAARMLDNYAGEDPVQYVFSILQAVRRKRTVWSLVFDAKNRRLYYFTARNPEIRYVSLNDFDPNCDSPVQILDINASGKGDVRKSFKDFTHEENARIARIAIDKWKAGDPNLDFSEADIEKTLNYHKMMQCLPHLPQADAAPGSLALSPSKQTYVYKTVGDCNIHADVYRPTDKISRPVILWLHGGALIWGSRSRIHPEQLTRYLNEGFIVVAIDYRLAPETKLPAILEDLQDAYTWICTEGPALFQADPDHIAVVGHSAGGYLALMAGFLMDSPPHALVSFYGYGDIRGAWYNQPDAFYSSQPAVSEEQADEAVGNEILSEASHIKRWPFYLYCRQQGRWVQEIVGKQVNLTPFCPIRNVTQAFPPTLLLHGDQDTDVPYRQSVHMAEKLQEKGVKHKLITLNDRGHAFDKFGEGMRDPVVADAFESVIRFIKENLSIQGKK